MSFGEHWEWRGFGSPPRDLLVRVENLPFKFSMPQDLADEYLWSPRGGVNVKLRSSDLKFKRLLESRDGLERWLEDSEENHAFPLPQEVLEKLVRELGVQAPAASIALKQPISRTDLLALLGRWDPPVNVIVVKKRRWQREWKPERPGVEPSEDPVTVELAEILEPEKVISIGLEHPLRERVAEALEALGLGGHLRPMSYLEALRLWAEGKKTG